jgi:YfiH family protein
MTAPPATTCELRQLGSLPVLGWPALDRRGAEVMVTTRHGGVSAGPYATLNLSFGVGDDPGSVRENRRRVAAGLGTSLADFVFARQVHGGRAAVVSAADRGRGTLEAGDAIADADALVTRDPGTVLAILVGDCVPIVLYDPVARVLAGVHAGWRGTVAGITRAALTAMAGLGSRPADVLAGLGPAIAPDRYQVGEDVREGIIAGLGDEAASVLRPDGTGRWLLDLWSANRIMLARAGVPESQIHVAAVPTGPGGPGAPGNRPVAPGASRSPADGPPGAGARPDAGAAGGGLFFSDRTARPCGRFALVARLTAAADHPTTSPATGRRSR